MRLDRQLMPTAKTHPILLADYKNTQNEPISAPSSARSKRVWTCHPSAMPVFPKQWRRVSLPDAWRQVTGGPSGRDTWRHNTGSRAKRERQACLVPQPMSGPQGAWPTCFGGVFCGQHIK